MLSIILSHINSYVMCETCTYVNNIYLNIYVYIVLLETAAVILNRWYAESSTRTNEYTRLCEGIKIELL